MIICFGVEVANGGQPGSFFAFGRLEVLCTDVLEFLVWYELGQYFSCEPYLAKFSPKELDCGSKKKHTTF